MSYKKIDKEFCLSDDSVNVYGYRCLTKGFLKDRFVPSVGFLMHNRESGVAVKWEEIRVADGKIFAKPVVNTTKFPTLADEIEAGFYSGASIGKIVALETSDDSKYKLEGQTGPTVLQWFPRECSIVDIPGNYSALAQLYDEGDNVLLDLSDKQDDINIKNNDEMEVKPLSASDLKLLNLADNATETQVSAKLQDLVDKATRCTKAEQDLADYKKQQSKTRVKELLDKGLADRKLTQVMSDKLGVVYAENPDGLKELIDTMPAQVVITDALKDVPAKWAGKSYHDLYLSGELAQLKQECPDYFEELKSKK